MSAISTAVISRVFHVNIVVSDMDRALAFYQRLGMRVIEDVSPRGADLTPHLGVDVTALRAVLLLPAGADGPMLDLVTFIHPGPVAQPYAQLDHIGACRVSFEVDNLADAQARLTEAGIAPVGPAVSYRTPIGEERYTVCFRDPDGTGLQFISARQQGDGVAGAPDGAASRFFHINLNVRDLARSKAFYAALGFQLRGEAEVEHPSLGVPLGVQATRLRTAFLGLDTDPGGPLLDLVEFVPHTDTQPYAHANNLGLVRVAFWVADLDLVLRIALQSGATPVSPRHAFQGPGQQAVVTAVVRDPDGIMLQFFSPQA